MKHLKVPMNHVGPSPPEKSNNSPPFYYLAHLFADNMISAFAFRDALMLCDMSHPL